MDWVDKREEAVKKEAGEGYFNLQEGDNRVQLLTHLSPLPQVWDGKKYRMAEEGDTNISIKGVGWVLQDGKIKQAKLPYTVVKAIRELQQDPDYAFEDFPMPRLINIKAKGAGSKEVEYTVIPAPKETVVSEEILTELSKKPSPQDIVEKIKGTVALIQPKVFDDIDEFVNPEDIPF